MGFYDYRCMLTGVSLQGEHAVLVPLFEDGGALAPVAFGIKGSYNRLGAIDNILEDANTAAILKFFLGKLATREFVVDEDYLRGHSAFPITHIEQLLAGFERNVTEYPRAARLNDNPVLYGLISQSVWQAIAEAALPFPSNRNVHQDLFAGSPIAAAIYGGRIGDLTTHAKELAAVMALMSSRDIAWSAPQEHDQWYVREMIQFLSEARAAFGDCPAVLEGLRAYERAVAEVIGN